MKNIISTKKHSKYVHSEIELKWQKIWEANRVFESVDRSDKPKYYVLVEFPYPSGQGLHVGHPRPYTGFDIVARKKRMEGFNVLYPMGWDAFGLPTENYAIQNKIHPKIVTQDNICKFKTQLKSMGFSFDWTREVNTTDPSYYRWTQWIFLKLFEHGLAYKAEMPINFCTSCKVGLANEEVVNGVCERCGSKVVKKNKSQWMLKITNYAESLLDGLETIDYTNGIKNQQINWIGRSEGADIRFNVQGTELDIAVFTTRPDTIFGVTYLAIAPESELIKALRQQIVNMDEVIEYRSEASKMCDADRTNFSREKTGVVLEGVTAVNPVSGAKIPIWTADYVLNYGTGAIMAVPGHDQRDWDFAKKYDLPIIEVVSGGNINRAAFEDTSGTLVNSGFLNGLPVRDATAKILAWLEENSVGHRKVNYKLRDWIFSRQRYWGEPIPLVFCDKCGWVPVPEEQLPLVLPEVTNYEPSEDGESPLARMPEWVNTICPKCGAHAKRETDTMPQWAGSSWYFLRYTDPHNGGEFASTENMRYWLPVDWYNGGNEHTTLHLLYSRFWHKFLYDIGVVPTSEPYKKRTSHGMILGENNEKMSKSRGNVVNPDAMVEEFGADTLRLYEMFMGAFDQSAAWSMDGIRGCRRFVERVWNLQGILFDAQGISDDMEKLIHKTIKKVTDDYEKMKFNTAVAAMMTLVNEFYAKGKVTCEEMRVLLLLLNPVAPHVTEELFEILGYEGYLYEQKWPKYDPSRMVEHVVEIPVQVNGKLRLVVSVSAELEEAAVKEEILKDETVRKHILGKELAKIIFVPGKIFNIVTR